VVKTPEEVAGLEAKLCETFLTLGEVSLESENYEQAVVDITECLNMRKVSVVDRWHYSVTNFKVCIWRGVSQHEKGQSGRHYSVTCEVGIRLSFL